MSDTPTGKVVHQAESTIDAEASSVFAHNKNWLIAHAGWLAGIFIAFVAGFLIHGR